MSAVKAADVFDLEVVRIPKSKAGADVIVPSVYLDDKLLAELNGIRDGQIEEEDLISELTKANVSKQ